MATRRNRRSRRRRPRTRSSRTQRGGSAPPPVNRTPVAPDQVESLAKSAPPLPPRGEVPWPLQDGCIGASTSIVVPAGTWVDRVGPTGEKSDYVAELKPDGTPYSFSSRSLPTFGAKEIPVTTKTRNGGIASIDFREQEYTSIYTKVNDPHGALYWHIQVKEELPGDECDVAPFYNYSPGTQYAKQIKLKEPILALAKRGAIAVYTTGGYYPPFAESASL